MSTPPAKHKHLMLDIETMGEAIMSVGAVPFSIHPERMEVAPISESFHGKVSLKESVLAGMTIDPDTVEWWLSQSKEAQTALLSGSRYCGLSELCQGFQQFCGDNLTPQNKLTVWAKPPEFDVRILQKAFSLLPQVWPFHYAATRDLRTLLEVASTAGMDQVFQIVPRVKHSAVEDARAQALQVVAIMSALAPVKRHLPPLGASRSVIVNDIGPK